MTRNGVIALLRAKVEKAGSAEKFAVPSGTGEMYVSPTYIRAVLAGKVDPGGLILSRLGLEKVVSYKIKEKPNA